MRFQHIEEIGRGGMGKICKAFTPDLDRWVTLKMLHPAISADPLYQARLKKEAEILARLSHPNIVSFIGYETVRIDAHKEESCLVMEYIDGESVQERLDREGLMTFEEVVPLFLKLCEAISYLHENHIFHFDLKPENILLNGEGRLFLTDFGIAFMHGSKEKTSPIHDPIGTIQYSSPEQVKGEDCDARSDLYSLGMVLYTLLSGKSYFDGKDKKRIWGELMYDPKAHQLTFPEEVPFYFQNMIRKMTEKSKEERYPDIHSLLREFHQRTLQPGSPARGEERDGFSEKVVILAAGMIVVIISFFFLQREFPSFQPPMVPSSKKVPSSSLRSTLFDGIPRPESAEPMIEIASLTREKAEEKNIGETLPSTTMPDAELERFLLHFKSSIENKNLEALEKEIAFSHENISYFRTLFQEHSRPSVEIRQIKQEGPSITIHYGITLELSSPVREGLLLFQDGVWNLTPLL